MKTLIIYTSQTGFTERYAKWLADRVSGDLINLKDARKKRDDYFEDYDAIVYGGWAMAGSVVKSKWFLSQAPGWKNKRLAMFCVGASPIANPDVEEFLDKALTDEQKRYIKLFYCQGGINYDKLKTPSRIAMKMFVSSLKKKKDASEREKGMAEMLATSYDISDIKYIEPIASFLAEA